MKTLLMKSVKRYYVNYFNGFSLLNEEELFSDLTIKSDYCVAGFSYGAQKAFEYVFESKKYIDRLILISPAFFQTQSSAFVRTQLRYFNADQESYVKTFLQNVAYPSHMNLSQYLHLGSHDELEALLTYKWDEDKIRQVLDRGVKIEVFLGAKDKIINAQDALAFFDPIVTTYFNKETGHIQLANEERK